MEPSERRGEEYKMKEKVSIIIPVYKTEKYLAACMDSVLQQDYPNLEVILVDDGSPDACPGLCEGYAAENACVTVIHQENQGAGMARNVGLERASGKYICFVDSDDCLDGTQAITSLVQCAEESQADVVVGNFRQLIDTEISDVYHHHLKAGDYVKTVDFRFKGFFQYGHLGFNWGKCYKKEFLDNYQLRCTTVPFTEDKAMNLCCCVCEPSYAFVDRSVYLYRCNQESVTSGYQLDLEKNWVDTAKHLQRFLAKENKEGFYWDLIDFHVCLGIFTIARQEFLAGNKKLSNLVCKLKEYGKNPLVKECMKDLAKGNYVSEIRSHLWKFFIRGTSVAFYMRWYSFLAVCFRFFRMTQLDKRIIAFKYKNEEKR